MSVSNVRTKVIPMSSPGEKRGVFKYEDGIDLMEGFPLSGRRMFQEIVEVVVRSVRNFKWVTI